MRLTAAVEGAATSLAANAGRSMLTALGIVIGIASVIVMSAFGNGLQGLVMKQIAAYDPTLTIVVPQSKGGAGQAVGQTGSFRDGDIDRLRRRLIGGARVGRQLKGSARVVSRGRSWSTQVVGVDAPSFSMVGVVLDAGRRFSSSEFRSGRPVAIVGRTVIARLGGTQSMPFGARLNGVPVQVVGVAKAGGGGIGVDQDDVIYLPLETARRRVPISPPGVASDGVQSIWMTFASEADALVGRSQTEEVLTERYSISREGLRPFTLISMKDQLEKSREALSAFGVALAAIASISLFVGGIGIMNMMLVSVSERTSEIGLRMAVGASPSDVLSQFLTEAVILCAAGGLAGIVLGALVTEMVRRRLPDWPLAWDWQSALVAVIVSCAIGLFFAIVPATRASRMPPVVALRR